MTECMKSGVWEGAMDTTNGEEGIKIKMFCMKYTKFNKEHNKVQHRSSHSVLGMMGVSVFWWLKQIKHKLKTLLFT